MESFPEVGDELRAGRVGLAQVRELARVNANPRIVGGIAPDVISAFLDEAKIEPYHGFVATVRSWEALVDADGSHDEHEVAHRRRQVSVNVVDKVGHLHGTFGAVNTSEMLTILEQFTRAEFLAEWEDVKARFGDRRVTQLLERTEAQRRADALMAIFRRAAAADPDGKDPDPIVNLVAPLDVYLEQLNAMLEDRAPNFDAHVDPAAAVHRRQWRAGGPGRRRGCVAHGSRAPGGGR